MPTQPDNTTAVDARAGKQNRHRPEPIRMALTHNLNALNSELAQQILEASGGPKKIADDLQHVIDNATVKSKGVETIDYRTRLAAQQLRLYYLLGKPIERQQVVTAKVDSESDLLSRLAHSPELREALREVLAAAESVGIVDVPKTDT